MPNWCENRLTVRGDKETRDSFFNENRDSESELTFAKAVPQKEQTCESNYSVWGTKWDACDVQVYNSDDELVYDFNTAWSPPEPWFYTIVKKYPSLQFSMEYSEPMNDFEGIIGGEDGEITEDDSWNYSETRWDELLESGIVQRYILENDSNDIEDITAYLERYNYRDDYAYIMENRIEKFREVSRAT